MLITLLEYSSNRLLNCTILQMVVDRFESYVDEVASCDPDLDSFLIVERCY